MIPAFDWMYDTYVCIKSVVYPGFELVIPSSRYQLMSATLCFLKTVFSLTFTRENYTWFKIWTMLSIYILVVQLDLILTMILFGSEDPWPRCMSSKNRFGVNQGDYTHALNGCLISICCQVALIGTLGRGSEERCPEALHSRGSTS